MKSWKKFFPAKREEAGAEEGEEGQEVLDRLGALDRKVREAQGERFPPPRHKLSVVRREGGRTSSPHYADKKLPPARPPKFSPYSSISLLNRQKQKTPVRRNVNPEKPWEIRASSAHYPEV